MGEKKCKLTKLQYNFSSRTLSLRYVKKNTNLNSEFVIQREKKEIKRYTDINEFRGRAMEEKALPLPNVLVTCFQ